MAVKQTELKIIPNLATLTRQTNPLRLLSENDAPINLLCHINYFRFEHRRELLYYFNKSRGCV